VTSAGFVANGTWLGKATGGEEEAAQRGEQCVVCLAGTKALCACGRFTRCPRVARAVGAGARLKCR
jgi:hypothetical protein